jgi:glycyl-tRNA synthetase alpha subunit|tara:strand:- start:18935 stop:19255 length:321 start_codon:yes stop_codon:yes gene_type:complete
MTEVPNLNYIKELAGDDIEFEKKFIDIIKKEFPEEVNAYLNHIENNKIVMAADVVHKLKHKFNILSMGRAYSFAVTYEENLRNDNKTLDKEYREILNNITLYLTTI